MLLVIQKLSVISSGSFLKDIEIEKLVTYHYSDESFLLTEVNNCVAISTTQGHDRTLHNTHASSKEECIKQCLSLYQNKLIGHPNSALTCTLWWTNEDPVIAHIFKKKSPIGKIWSDTKLNDNNFKNVVIYNPRFDNKGEFQGF